MKKPGVPARAALDESLTSYKHPQNGIPALFVFNALLIASNSTDCSSANDAQRRLLRQEHALEIAQSSGRDSGESFFDVGRR